jgi:hypothetical protein
MRLQNIAAAAASVGVASAGVIQARSSQDTCANTVFTGEVLHLSVNIVEYPVIVDVELKEDAVVTIDNTILIDCTNAPTHLHTTVFATATSTITKTVSTATITATAGGVAGGAAAGSEQTNSGAPSTTEAERTVATQIGTKTQSLSVDDNSSGGGSGNGNYKVSTKTKAHNS